MKASLPLVSVALLLLLIPSAFGAGEPASVPVVVEKGFAELQKNGSLAAMAVWFAGSARENDEDQDRASTRMNNVQGLLGRMTGYDIVRWITLSPSTQRGYAAVKFEKGVAWMSFDCYRPGNEWIISRFDFGTNANLILPPNILGGQ